MIRDTRHLKAGESIDISQPRCRDSLRVLQQGSYMQKKTISTYRFALQIHISGTGLHLEYTLRPGKKIDLMHTRENAKENKLSYRRFQVAKRPPSFAVQAYADSRLDKPTNFPHLSWKV